MIPKNSNKYKKLLDLNDESRFNFDKYKNDKNDYLRKFNDKLENLNKIKSNKEIWNKGN